MSLGKRIKEFRIRKGLTQSDLGSGFVTPSMISQIESDKAKPSYQVLEAIAKKLELPLEYFLTDLGAQLEQQSAFRYAKALLASGSFETAEQILKQILKSPKNNLEPLEVQYDRGNCLMELNRYDEAFHLLVAVSDKGISEGKPHLAIQAMKSLGELELRRGKHPSNAIFYWRKACEHFHLLSTTDAFLQGEILYKLGSIYEKIGDLPDALFFLHEARKLLENTLNLEQIGKIYLTLSATYRKTGEYALAADFATYAFGIFSTLKNFKLVLDVERTLANLQLNQSEFDTALKTLEYCLNESEKYNFVEEAAIVQSEIAWLHLQQKEFWLCLAISGQGAQNIQTRNGNRSRLAPDEIPCPWGLGQASRGHSNDGRSHRTL